MTTRSTILFLILLLTTVTFASACAPTQRDVAVFSGLVLQFEADRSRVGVGDRVNMRFKVENTRDYTIVLESPTTPVMDMLIHVVGGPDLLTWSSQNPDKVQHRLEWKPGETKTIEWVWIPRPEDIASGYYRDVFLGGLLYQGGKIIQSANVQVCASNFCR